MSDVPVPPVTSFDKPTSAAAEEDPRGFLGWRVVWNDKNERPTSSSEGNGQQSGGDWGADPATKSMNAEVSQTDSNIAVQNGYGMQPMVPNLFNFQSRFDNYLHSIYGDKCYDDGCSNLKNKFWKVCLLFLANCSP